MQSSPPSKFIPIIIDCVKYNIPTLVCIRENVDVSVERFEVDLETLGLPYCLDPSRTY
jgi:hypothetical protein